MVDAGDYFGLTSEQDSLKARFMIDAMDRLGYDVITVGERDFNFGQQFLLDAFKKTKMDVVSANIVYADTKKPFLKPYVVRKAGNVRIAFFGLMGSQLRYRTRPDDRALEILDPVETAKKLIPEMRKKADVIVLLSHLGLTDGQKLTLEAPGIDVMIFGHQVGLAKQVVSTQNVINVRGSERGQYIPQIHLVIEDGKIASFDGDVVTLDSKIPADEVMGRLVDTFSDDMNRRFAEKNANAADQAAGATHASATGDQFLGEKNCRRCHEAEYQMYTKQAHAHAFATLEKNQRDATPECLPCHVVGMNQPGGFVSKPSTPDLVNVQCENCHGMGTKHPEPGSVTGPDVCITCHTHEQDPNFNYDEAVEKIVHWE
ncbi:MAG TPA: multiheme c-type cytochrome [Candidatus Eisenbacteria bacterium]|nr:multiheme c-type cytochrome [Candidatus Eisenbacteria bacterium]